MPDLNLSLLQTFLDVVELGSFSAAAERQGVSQPAVSLQMRQLERQLGVRLVERVARRATPTAAGRELVEHSHRIHSVVADAVDAMARHGTGIAGRLTLGTGATACLYFLPPILAKLRRAWPELNIVVRTGNSSDFIAAVDDNRMDLALVTLPATGRALQVTPVLQDEFVLVLPRTGPPFAGAAMPLALSALPLVLFEPAAHTRTLVDAWFRRARIGVRPVMELGSVEAIKEMVAAGLGYGNLPRMAVAGRAARADLAVRPLAPRLHRTLALVMRRDKPFNRGMQEVVKAVLAAARPGKRE